MNWWEKYIGLPYSKYNCGELVALVARERIGVQIHIEKAPDHPLKRDKFLQNVFPEFVKEKIESPEECAVVLMSGKTLLSHVGVVVGSVGQWMLLHSSIDFGSVCCHRMDSLDQIGLRHQGAHGEGFYRLCR